jgi:hypothetical protein
VRPRNIFVIGLDDANLRTLERVPGADGYRSGLLRFDDLDLDVDRNVYERYSWTADDFCSVTGETSWSMQFSRGDWTARTETKTTVTCTTTDFVVDAQLDAYEGACRSFSRNWHKRIPRDHV